MGGLKPGEMRAIDIPKTPDSIAANRDRIDAAASRAKAQSGLDRSQKIGTQFMDRLSPADMQAIAAASRGETGTVGGLGEGEVDVNGARRDSENFKIDTRPSSGLPDSGRGNHPVVKIPNSGTDRQIINGDAALALKIAGAKADGESRGSVGRVVNGGLDTAPHWSDALIAQADAERLRRDRLTTPPPPPRIVDRFKAKLPKWLGGTGQ